MCSLYTSTLFLRKQIRRNKKIMHIKEKVNSPRITNVPSSPQLNKTDEKPISKASVVGLFIELAQTNGVWAGKPTHPSIGRVRKRVLNISGQVCWVCQVLVNPTHLTRPFIIYF
jgi:hypothetical protein